MMLRKVLLLGAVLSLMACDPPVHILGPPVLTTDRMAYAAGDTVMLRLENRTDEPLYFSACSPLLQRHEEDTWVDRPPDALFCGQDVISVFPGTSGTATTPLDKLLSPGEYHYQVKVWVGADGESTQVPSNPFLVTSAATP